MNLFTRIKRSIYYKRADALSEMLFIALTGMYLFYKSSKSTAFGLPWPSGLGIFLLIALATVSTFRLLFIHLKSKKTVVALGFTFIYCMVYRSDGYRFLLFMAALTAGCIDIDYRKLLLTWLLSVGLMYAMSLCAGMIHAIPNYIRIKDGLRSSWGMCYPTDFATLGLYVVMTLWVSWKKLPDWAMLFFCMGSVALSWYIAHSYTSTLCGLLFGVAIIYHSLERNVISRYSNLAWISKGIDRLTIILFPLCAIIVFAMMALYARGTNLAYRINHLTSNRLEYMVKMWTRIGVTAFGTPFSTAGDGFSNFPPMDYTFVDSTYPLIVLRYGVVLFIAYCLSWGWTVRKAVWTGDQRLVLVMGIIAIHSISEHHFIECDYNILVVLPLASFSAQVLNAGDRSKSNVIRHEQGQTAQLRRASIYAAVMTALLCIVLLVVFGPALLSWFKTVLEINGLCGGKATGFALAGCVLAFLCLCGATVMGLYGIARGLIGRSSLREYKAPVAVLLASAIIWAGAWFYADRIIEGAAVTYKRMLKADRKALKIATDSASKNVYSGIMPAVYKRDNESVSYAAFFGDDLSRLHGSTALMDANEEHNAFFDSGCLYVQISDAHALYTSDKSVIDALTKAGYHLTGYYSTANEVDLKAAAEAYNLKYSSKKGVLLKNRKQSLRKGPYVDLYGGRYTVTYELSLPRNASNEEGLVCTLSVTTYKGKNVLLEKEILRSQFDGNGKLTVSIPFTIGDSKSVAFRARTEKGRKVYVKSIRYVRTPDYDIHALYDSMWRKVRQEYYTLDGAATMGPSGYFAIEYGYDGQNNINSIRYYNQDNEPTLHTSGYAEVRRVFNANRKIIREDYFGIDGKPIALTNGQAAVEREYDGAGNNTVIRYYGIDGNPVITKSGYASVRREFDENGKIVNEEYFGVDGEPIPLKSGQYNIEQEYDEAGNVIVKRFYGEDGILKQRSEGYAEVHWQYNGMHQIVREEFFDAKGEPVIITNGYWADEREYDDAGNVIAYRYYGLENEPILTKSGYAELHRSFDERRRIVREEYYDVDHAPIALTSDQYAMENEYDEDGNVSVRRFYGVDDKLTLRRDGYAEVHWKYNDMRQIIREEFFGTDGKPILISTGQAANEREYDSSGNITVYRYFGLNGEPIVIHSGYAEIRREYNEKRQIVKEAYFDVDGAPMIRPEGHSMIEQEYDQMGNVSVKRYLDGENKPICITEGYAEVHRRFDNKKQIVFEAYYGEDGEPLAQAAGHFAIEQSFDDSGNLVLRRYLDAQGNPMLRTDGFAEARWSFDNASNSGSLTLVDLDGQPVEQDGINLAMNVNPGWSKWETPRTNMRDYYPVIGKLVPGERQVGDRFTSQIEIEFSGVTDSEGEEFRFSSNGTADSDWAIRNIWNGKLVTLTEPPEDGIYRYVYTCVIDENNVDIREFVIGFLCNQWASGKFRVRNVKIERGDHANEWTPGL